MPSRTQSTNMTPQEPSRDPFRGFARPVSSGHRVLPNRAGGGAAVAPRSRTRSPATALLVPKVSIRWLAAVFHR